MDLPSRMASCDEIWIANQTGALIAAVSAGRHFAADAVRRAVCQMAMIIGAGYPYRAAKVCGFSKARQFDWMNGTRLIKFKPLLVLCAAAGVDVVSAMQGHVWPGTGCNYRYVARSPNGTLTPFDERRQILLLAADRAECPSLSQVARELNVSTRTLRKAFPEETALIIARYLERVRSDRTMRALRTKEALEEIVERLHIDGRPVTARNVWLEGGIMVTPNSRFMSAFRQLLELDRAESRTGNDDTGCNDVVPK
ncbi:hypothetical protein [Paraburkholderia caribensis]|uniref:hypothetical protein n=1 Tax=Paraburkholderia caribensis TaxID=75105 RepID=UPI001E375001|nr:hypothetical protein [Paraburkholderia caribensis]